MDLNLDLEINVNKQKEYLFQILECDLLEKKLFSQVNTENPNLLILTAESAEMTPLSIIIFPTGIQIGIENYSEVYSWEINKFLNDKDVREKILIMFKCPLEVRMFSKNRKEFIFECNGIELRKIVYKGIGFPSLRQNLVIKKYKSLL